MQRLGRARVQEADDVVRAFDGRPALPVGTSVSSTTFLRTRSRAIARFTARLRQDLTPCTVRVLRTWANAESQASTSAADRSRILRRPSWRRRCFSQR